MTADMFDPLEPQPDAGAGAGADATAPQTRIDGWQVPDAVPDDAPELDSERLCPVEPRHEAEKVWDYHLADGKLAFKVLRWNQLNGGKAIRPATCGVSSKSGKMEWRLKAYPAPRPLYNLPALLATETGKRVLIVEGEKCAEVAKEISKNSIVTTWTGGAKAWKQTDWKPLKGRTVVLWPDADDPGRKVMRDIAAHLTKLGCTVVVLEPGDDLPKGYDIADALEKRGEDGTKELFKQLCENARQQRQGGSANDAQEEPGDAGAGDANQQTRPPDPDETATAGQEAAAGEGDWRAGLLEACKNDPGAPFERDMLEKIAELKKADPADWQRLRTKLKQAKISVTDLDAALNRAGNVGRELQGQAIRFVDPDPHPDPQDGAALLDDIKAMILKYIYLADEDATACALWIVFTWLHEQLEYSPFLHITLATKQCGKTQLGKVVGSMVRRPKMMTGAPTPAVLFRQIDKHAPTLLLDEADNYIKEYPELRGMINGSTEKDYAFVDRCEGEEHEDRTFATFCPKLISGIGGLHDTTLDRCITIDIQRKPKHEHKPSFRKRDLAACGDRGQLDAIKARCVRWLRDNVAAVLEARGKVTYPRQFGDRQKDGWEALFAIAHVAGGAWPNLALTAAKFIEVRKGENIDDGEQLINDIHEIFQQLNEDEIFTEDLIKKLTAMPHGKWDSYGRTGKPITAKALSNRLKQFRASSGNVRIDPKRAKGYKRASFTWAFETYISEDPPYKASHRPIPLPIRV